MVIPRMHVTVSLGLATWIILVLATLTPIFARGEPDPMARPTRPKVFTSPEELRRYLDLVRDYYSLNGKARYGKRSQIVTSPRIIDYPWDALRTIVTLNQQAQRNKQEKQDKEEKKERERQENLHNQVSQGGEMRQIQDLVSQPSYLYDMMAKYYDEMQ
ncbi:uncharacterized protein LOC107272220 [Cephus cinctus]|uniref:Uncharacterized protein LOC107272220 n=1 Tax=Cephus cinctus TaxID=211228 RepID=A0AAJ7C9P7_CEPCN|nr:uncharacterized protein LOC107272220 [Cephus cinctus]